MFADFWQIHSDVIRNSFVLLVLVLAGATITALVTWRLVRARAYRDANQNIIQENVELRIRNDELRQIQASHLATIERLTVVQNGALGAARTVQELVSEKG